MIYLFWQTRDNLNPYTRLDQTTALPLPRHLTHQWLCPSLEFSTLLWLGLLLWQSFREALKSCFTDIPASNLILYYTTLINTFLLRRAFNPLLRTLRYQWLCSRSGFSSLSQFSLWLSFMKHSSPALIRTKPRGHAEKKKSNKTCCNQNMSVLPLPDDLQC